MNEIVNGASNELSVTPLSDGRFVLIFQVLGLSDKVGMRIGASPVGPFLKSSEIYNTPEMESGLWCYNAKAHFNLSQPDEQSVTILSHQIFGLTLKKMLIFIDLASLN